jgi:hypothetical protein
MKEQHRTKSPAEKHTSSIGSVATETINNQQQLLLLSAILRNCPVDVQQILSQDDRGKSINPNFIVSFGKTKNLTTTTTTTTSSSITIDQVFKLKRLLGETPTALHIAVLNVYCQYTGGGGSPGGQKFLVSFIPGHRRGEVDKAIEILKILVEYCRHEDHVHQISSSAVMFPTRNDKQIGLGTTVRISPTNLAESIHQLTESLQWKSVSDNFIAVVNILKSTSVGEESEARDLNNVDRPKQQQDGMNNESAADQNNNNNNNNKNNNNAMIREMTRDDLDEVIQLIFGNLTIDTNSKTSSKPSQAMGTNNNNGLLLLCHVNHEDVTLYDERPKAKILLLTPATIEKREP